MACVVEASQVLPVNCVSRFSRCNLTSMSAAVQPVVKASARWWEASDLCECPSASLQSHTNRTASGRDQQKHMRRGSDVRSLCIPLLIHLLAEAGDKEEHSVPSQALNNWNNILHTFARAHCNSDIDSAA